MATGAQMSRFYNKKNMPWDQFDTMFQAFLRQQIADAVAANMPAPFTYLPGPGTVVPVTAPSVNAISVGVTGGPYAATDGQGHIFKFTAAYGATNMASIRVPPDAGVLYGVALESCLVEDQTIEVNPRTGAFEYRNFIEDIGRVVSPSAVTWVGSTLTLTFQSTTAFEVGKDNTGRLLRVWLKSKSNGGPGPQSAIAARAFYTGALNSLNQIVLTTAGLGWVPFNQATPSTTPSDYTALIKGPTIRRQAPHRCRLTNSRVRSSIASQSSRPANLASFTKLVTRLYDRSVFSTTARATS